MPSRATPDKPAPRRHPSRALGYGGSGVRVKDDTNQNPQRSTLITELAAWLATTALAGALLLLLAQHDRLLASLAVAGYAAVSWILWRTRRIKRSGE